MPATVERSFPRVDEVPTTSRRRSVSPPTISARRARGGPVATAARVR